MDTREINEAIHPILKYFAFEHLPPHLQEISGPFHHMAHDLADTLNNGPEKEMAFRKLLEAKDCAVRAAL